MTANPDVACRGGNTGNKALQIALTVLRDKLQGNIPRITGPLRPRYRLLSMTSYVSALSRRKERTEVHWEVAK